MEEKNIKISKLKHQQNKLVEKAKRKKKYIPYTLSFFFILTISIIFFYDYTINQFFGNRFGILAYLVSFICLVSVIYLIVTYFKVRSINYEIKSVNSKLYNLMRLKLNKK